MPSCVLLILAAVLTAAFPARPANSQAPAGAKGALAKTDAETVAKTDAKTVAKTPPPHNAQRADDIIQKHIEALGGVERIKALQSLRVSGRFEQKGIEFPFTLWRERPDKNRLDVGFKGMFFMLGHFGGRSWWVNPFAGVFKPEPVPRLYTQVVARWSQFEEPLVDYKLKGHRAEYVGDQKTERGALHCIKLTLANGDVWHVFIDSATYLEVKRSFPQAYGGRVREAVTWFRDYATVNGVRVCRVIDGEAVDGTRFTMTLFDYEANLPIEASRFTKP